MNSYYTRSYAVAKKPRNASSLSINITTIRRPQVLLQI